MKKVFSVCLCLFMLIGLIPMTTFAGEWTTNAPTIYVTTEGLEEGGVIGVTVHIDVPEASTDIIQAFGLGIEYDSTKVDVATDLGDYKTNKGKTFGLTVKSEDEWFLYNTTKSIQVNYDRIDDGADTKVFFITDANSYDPSTEEGGITAKGMDVTFFFRVKDGVGGGVLEFKLSDQKVLNKDGVTYTGMFKVSNGTDEATYPTENNSVSVAIPLDSITVSGSLKKPAKGALVEEANTLTVTPSDYVEVVVEWDKPLAKNEAGKAVFAASTVYTATVTVQPKDGAAFAENAELTDNSGLGFKREGDVFKATAEFDETAGKSIVSWTVDQSAAKLTGYVDGDKFDTSTLKITATYDDESTVTDYTGYTVAPETLTKGDTTVTLTSNEVTEAGAALTETITLTDAVAGKTEGFADEFLDAEGKMPALTEEYTGSDLAAAFTGKLKAANLTATPTYTFKDAEGADAATLVKVGTYAIYATITGDAHYADITTPVKVADAEITVKAVKPSIGTIAAETYTGKAIEPAITVTCDPALTADTDYTVAYANNINAGTATVTLKAVEGSNFTFEDVTAEFTINALEVAVTWDTTPLTYNGEAQAPAATATGVEGETINLTVTGAQTDAGTGYTATAAIESVEGGRAKAENYVLTEATATTTFDIAKAVYTGEIKGAVTAPAKGASDKEFNISALSLPDGCVDAKVVSAAPAAEAGIVTAAAKASDATVKFSTSAADDGATGKFEIVISSKNLNDVKATVTVTAKTLELPEGFWKDNVTLTESVTYGAKDGEAVKLPAGTVTIKDPENKDVSGTLSLKEADTVRSVGKYDIVVVADFDGTTFEETFSYSVVAVEVAAVWADTELTYTGAAQAPTATAEGVNGETLTLTVTGEQTDAGEDYTATAAIESVTGGNGDIANYILTNATAKFTIAQKEVVVSGITAANKTYDGTTAATLDFSAVKFIEKSGAAVTDSALNVTATGAFADANAGKGKTVSISELKLADTAKNYTLAAEGQQTETTADIDPKVVKFTVSLEKDTVDYNYEEQPPVVTVKDGDTELKAEDYTVTVDPATCKDAGTYTVTVKGAGNYEGSTADDLTYTIVAKAPTFDSFSATGDVDTMTVEWSAKDNGSAITGFVVTVSHEGDADITVSVAADQTSVEIPDLVEGETYKVKVTATNAIGSTDSEEIEVEMVYYEEETAHTVTIVEAEHGKVEIGISEYEVDAKVNVKVTPDEGYELDSLKVIDADGNPIKVTENKGSYSFTMPDSDVKIKATFKSTTGEKSDMPFEDVEEGSVYEEAVYWALEEDVTNGTSETTFSPYDPCTRAEAVTFLWRAAGSPEPTITECPFEDVLDSSAYYFDAVLWAYENGITKGTSETEFSPLMTVTRGQMITFLYRMVGEKAKTGDIPFTDVDADAYYAEAVMWAVANGVTNGTTATTFSPDEQCVRYQVVTFLYRYFK